MTDLVILGQELTGGVNWALTLTLIVAVGGTILKFLKHLTGIIVETGKLIDAAGAVRRKWHKFRWGASKAAKRISRT